MKTLRKYSLRLFVIILLIQFLPDTGFSQPPPWAPAHGYRSKTTYIYFPQYNFYFDLSRRVYFVWVSPRWVTYTVLPPRYTKYNLAIARQVELDISSKYPYYYNAEHRTKYVKVKANPKLKPAPAVNKNKGTPPKSSPPKSKPGYKPAPVKGKPAPGKGQGHGKGHGKGH